MAASLSIDATALEVGASCNLVYPGPRDERRHPICEHPGCRSEAIGPFSYLCYRHWTEEEPPSPFLENTP